MIGLALTVVSNGQKSMTLEDVDILYKNAIHKQANDLHLKVVELQISYVKVLNSYRDTLLTSRDTSVLVVIAALDAEVKNVAVADEGKLAPLLEGADAKILSLRKTYEQQLATFEANNDKAASALEEKMIGALESLKESLVKSGKVQDALTIHKRLVNLGAATDKSTNNKSTNSNDTPDNKCVVLTKTNGGYVNAVSKQKLKLTSGDEYTLTFFVKFSGKILSSHDCLPRFRRTDGTNFEGGDKNKMQKAQRHSEKLEMSNARDGWDKITVKFIHFYDEAVRFGLEFYSPDGSDYQVAMTDFVLTDSEGNNLISKNLNSSVGWESGDYISFTARNLLLEESP